MRNVSANAAEIQERLAAPFPASEVKWKPQAVKNGRALAIAYINARAVQDRLDDVLGIENWKDSYEVLADGSVLCTLSIRINGEWTSRSDVGSLSEQPDGGDRLKAAFSDSLKRVAVKFGVGRFLYSLPQTWCDYDASKKQFAKTPSLPASLFQKTAPQASAPTQSKPVERNGVAQSQQQPVGKTVVSALKVTERMKALDAEYTSQGRCEIGGYSNDFIKEVIPQLKNMGFDPRGDWDKPMLDVASAFQIKWEQEHPEPEHVTGGSEDNEEYIDPDAI